MSDQQPLTNPTAMADPELLNRAHSALDEIEAGEMAIESTTDGTFTVKGEYEVDPNVPNCSCKDYEYRTDFCKHIVAVEMQMLWGNVEPRTESESDTPPKPSMLDVAYDAIPRTLRGMDHWVGWKQKIHENKDGTQRWTKVPIDVENGGFASSTGPATWTTFDTAAAHCRRTDSETVGIGFVVGDDDAVVGIDIDDCRDPETGAIDPAVEMILDEVETYAEVSPSGTGIRIFVLGEVPAGTGNEADLPGEAHIELYWTGRYLTVTGQHIDRTPDDITWDSDTLDAFRKRVSGEMDLSEFSG